MADPLDPSLPASILLGGPVDPSQGTVHQQAAFDDVTGDVYATQVISGGQTIGDETEPVSFEDRARRGDLAINRISPEGALLGVMYCRGFDHGAGLGVQRAGGVLYLWTGYDAAEAAPGADGYATKIARFPFEDGAVLDVGDPGIDVYDHRPGFDHITPSVDPANDQIALRYHSGGDYFITVYRLSTFTPADPGEVLYAERQIPVASQFQAWVIFDEYVYSWHGYAEDRAFFTIYSLPEAGLVGGEITNDQYPDLVYREAESIAILGAATDDPLIAWGFATGTTGDRQINLYAPVPLPPTRIEATVVPEGVALTVDIEDPASATLWQVIRRPDGAILFTGDGDDLPDPPVQMLDTAPLRCTDMTYELRVVRGGAEETVTSDTVQYVPPEGCGAAGGVAETPETIGCPDLYRARVHWRGGALTLPLQGADHLVECTWQRTLNDTAEATATFSRDVFDDCCNEFTDVHPWTHELTIYRESVGARPEIVWQGPIVRVRVQTEQIIIEAQDVFAWLDRLVNTWRMNYTAAAADDVGRRRGTVTYIAQNIIKLNMIDSSLSVPDDYAAMYSYIRTRADGLSTIQWRKDGTTVDDETGEVTVRARIWRQFVGEILRELAKSGLRWTTIGRTLYLRSQSSALSLPIARLSFADFSGETEIVRDGLEAATRTFATNQQGDELAGLTVSAGRTETPYGRLDRLVNVQEDTPTEAQLRRIATNDLAGRYPAPMAISMPGTAQLLPEAPITVRELVPGERIDVTGDACFTISQGFLLTDVAATWDSDAGERMSVGLTTLPPYAESGDI